MSMLNKKKNRLLTIMQSAFVGVRIVNTIPSNRKFLLSKRSSMINFSGNSANQVAALPAHPAPDRLPVPFQSTPASSMPAITPYQPRIQPTAFGVPMTQPGRAGSSHQSRRRGAANQEATAARIRRLNIKIMMVLFPRDVSLKYFIFSNSTFLNFF
jgi:hypothetical protein